MSDINYENYPFYMRVASAKLAKTRLACHVTDIDYIQAVNQTWTKM